MGQIIGRFLLPHPPAAIAELSGKSAEKLNTTVTGMQKVAAEIKMLKPDTVIMITPHGPLFQNHFYFPGEERISGDFAMFGNKRRILAADNDLSLAAAIQRETANNGFRAGAVDERTLKQNGFNHDLDHGVTVPLYFLQQATTDFRLLPISVSTCSAKEHYRFGIILRQAIINSDRNVVIIASGNLSHKLNEESPYGCDECGIRFDRTVKKLLFDEDITGFLTFDPRLKTDSIQCSLDSYRMLLGTLDGFRFMANTLSYEDTLGIGYLVANLKQGKPTESAYTHYTAAEADILKARHEQESEPVNLAREALRYWFREHKPLPLPKELGEELKNQRGGVFVTLENDGIMRGSIGTTTAHEPNLAEEIITNAIAAATADSRFEPISPQEAEELTVTVDILSTPEETTVDGLDPAKYGIIAENRGRIGVLLPALPEITTVKDQLAAVRAKAGIHPWHRLKLKRFTVKHFQ